MSNGSTALEVSHRKVWLLAGPIILANLSVPLVGASDAVAAFRACEAAPPVS